MIVEVSATGFKGYEMTMIPNFAPHSICEVEIERRFDHGILLVL